MDVDVGKRLKSVSDSVDGLTVKELCAKAWISVYKLQSIRKTSHLFILVAVLSWSLTIIGSWSVSTIILVGGRARRFAIDRFLVTVDAQRYIVGRYILLDG